MEIQLLGSQGWIRLIQGVPIRLELGPKDLSKNETRCVIRRDGSSLQLSLDSLVPTIHEKLNEIQSAMFESAKRIRDDHLISCTTFDSFVKALNEKNLLITPWCDRVSCEESVKDRSARATSDEAVDEKAPSMGAKTLCIPFKQPDLTEGQVCFACEEKATCWTVWGRSY